MQVAHNSWRLRTIYYDQSLLCTVVRPDQRLAGPSGSPHPLLLELRVTHLAGRALPVGDTSESVGRPIVGLGFEYLNRGVATVDDDRRPIGVIEVAIRVRERVPVWEQRRLRSGPGCCPGCSGTHKKLARVLGRSLMEWITRYAVSVGTVTGVRVSTFAKPRPLLGGLILRAQ